MIEIIEPSLAFLGSVIGAVGGLLGASKQASTAKENARSANLYTTEQMKNKHQWQVSDLKKAGLNPVLSAGGNTPMGGSAMAAPVDIMGSSAKGVESAMAALTEDLLAEQIKTEQSKQAQNYSSAKQADATADLTRTQDTQQERLESVYDLIGDVTSGGVDIARKTPSWVKNKYNEGKNSAKSFGKKIGKKIKSWF